VTLPRERIAAVLGPMLLGALVGSLVAGRMDVVLACIAIGTLAAALAGARWPSAAWVRRLAVGAGIAIVLNVLLTVGRRLPAPLPGTWEGLAGGTLLALRLLGAGIALHGLGAAWPGERAADELASRLRPLERLGVPVRAARAVVGLGLRFAPLVAAEANRIARLQDARAGGPPRNRREWLERRQAVAVPLVVCSLERAERVALGMEARHYRVRPVPALPRAWGFELAGLALAGVALLWRS